MWSLVSVVLLFLFTLCLTQMDPSQFIETPCGISTSPNINGGHNAAEKKSIWMAAIFNSSHFQCGGTIIHTRFVLSAAHCLLKQDRLYVRLGALNINDPAAVYNVIKILPHPEFVPLQFRNDIGLLQLSESIIYTVRVQPICIFLDPRLKGVVENLKTFTTLGWGYKNGNVSTMLQTIDLLHFNRSDCKSTMNVDIDTRQICAGLHNGDTCTGGSGGPLTTRIKFPLNQIYEVQLGILSFGGAECKGAGVYTDVTSYVDWILLTIHSHDNPSIGRSEGDIAMRNPIVPDSNPAAAPRLPPMLYNNCSQNIEAPLQIYWPGSYAVGVLITDQLIIAAATDLPLDAANLYVFVVIDGVNAVYQIESVSKHPHYTTNDYQNDIAALKLVQPISSNARKPICILTTQMYQQSAEKAQELNVVDTVLAKQFAVKLVERKQCAKHLGFQIYENQVCVDDPSDTSNPRQKRSYILVARMNANGQIRYILFGILSFSSNSILVFTNVMRHTDWIRSLL
ncbi:prostasin [Drosophila simulans]|uniref:GD11268 n=1 Tax=Drosophila simulans TaxID=7240 RepID=B4QAT8_DROSI|nr:prostasin [Drosophila simulans]EDX07489.1 GD11268 [Drosophila simulans]KMY94542.1 uncharacterized protein Dsimw501_GD11268 [Drosophila simulans]